MSPSPKPNAAPLPPLPDMPPAPQGSSQSMGGDPMQALLMGIAPVKTGVDSIMQACKQIVQSGAVPGAEQICGQIMASATQLLTMAASQMMGPSAAGSQGGIPPVTVTNQGPPAGPQGA